VKEAQETVAAIHLLTEAQNHKYLINQEAIENQQAKKIRIETMRNY
jgi:hypothetical protein